MKKEYIILILVIAALSAYLVFKKDDRSHYTLPEPPKVAADDVDRLLVEKKDGPVEFTKKDGKWVVTDKNYPADESAVNQMLEVVANLKISALVSEKGDLVRYELDPDHALSISAFQGDKQLIAFKAGKAAPSYNHTFVQLGDDARVFHGQKSFRFHFDKVVDDYRDKNVMDFPEESITSITLEKEGITKTLTVKPVEKPEAKDDKDAEPKADEKPSFLYADGTAPNKETVTNLLDALSSLKCDSFPESPTKEELEKQAADLRITLENDGKIVLNLYKGEGEDSDVSGVSSMNAYAFALRSYTAKDINSYADELLGIKKKQEDKTEE